MVLTKISPKKKPTPKKKPPAKKKTVPKKKPSAKKKSTPKKKSAAKKETGIRSEVLQRLLFAKSLLRNAEPLCTSQASTFDFAQGLLLLHDAAEAGLGAIADQLHAPLSPTMYLLSYYDKIKEADPKKREVPYRTNLRNLNTIRSNIKHKGIFPNQRESLHYPSTVFALMQEVCQQYLRINFRQLSLSDLIEEEIRKEFIVRAQLAIEREDYEAALVALATADSVMFRPGAQETISAARTSGYVFKDPYGVRLVLDLLAAGIDVEKYRAFRDLIPTVGWRFGGEEGCKIEYKWDEAFGHEANWTEANARRALDFCIDCALKMQRVASHGFDLAPKSSNPEDDA